MRKSDETKKKVFVARAAEAASVIEALLASGVSRSHIAKATGVSERTVYRWHTEGYAPHPIMLDSLRKLATKWQHQQQ